MIIIQDLGTPPAEPAGFYKLFTKPDNLISEAAPSAGGRDWRLPLGVSGVLRMISKTGL